MTDKRPIERAIRGNDRRNERRSQGRDQGEMGSVGWRRVGSAGSSKDESPDDHYVDPAEGAMNRNPPLSPPTRWSSETPSRVI